MDIFKTVAQIVPVTPESTEIFDILIKKTNVWGDYLKNAEKSTEGN